MSNHAKDVFELVACYTVWATCMLGLLLGLIQVIKSIKEGK